MSNTLSQELDKSMHSAFTIICECDSANVEFRYVPNEHRGYFYCLTCHNTQNVFIGLDWGRSKPELEN